MPSTVIATDMLVVCLLLLLLPLLAAAAVAVAVVCACTSCGRPPLLLGLPAASRAAARASRRFSICCRVCAKRSPWPPPRCFGPRYFPPASHSFAIRVGTESQALCLRGRSSLPGRNAHPREVRRRRNLMGH